MVQTKEPKDHLPEFATGFGPSAGDHVAGDAEDKCVQLRKGDDSMYAAVAAQTERKRRVLARFLHCDSVRDRAESQAGKAGGRERRSDRWGPRDDWK